jgi:arylsulfatase A-like enzyme
VHTPIQAKPAIRSKYEGRDLGSCQGNTAYAAMVDNLDQNIGQILQTLETEGLDRETLVIFTSDNGGIRSISCQDPIRAGKGSYYEGGIRVPLIFRWPERIPPGTTSESPVTNLDFFPTLLDILGEEPDQTMLDGLSLWDHLSRGEELEERALYFHFPIYLQADDPLEDKGRDPLFRTRPGSVIRRGDWKLHYYYEDRGVELYDLVHDPGESHNLTAIRPARAEELLRELRQWLAEHEAPVEFLPNPEYDKAFDHASRARFTR